MVVHSSQCSLVENEITDEGAIAFAEYLSVTTTLKEMR
jgi:hypothetical protein